LRKLITDLEDSINLELRKIFKTEHNYEQIKKKLLYIIKRFIISINKAIYYNRNVVFDLFKQNNDDTMRLKTINQKDYRIIYNIIILVLEHFPNKLFKLTKYKFSNVRRYFIYKVDINEKYKNKFDNRILNTEYLIFDYSEDNESDVYRNVTFIVSKNLEDLKTKIKKYFKIKNSSSSESKSVSLNNSENFKMKKLSSSKSEKS